MTPSDLHSAILALPCAVPRHIADDCDEGAYREGHADALRAAAALVHQAQATDPGRTMDAKHNAVQQAQQWALEASTQRDTVLSILRHFGLPERDWEALSLIKAKFADPGRTMDALTDDYIVGLWLAHRPIDGGDEAIAFARAVLAAASSRQTDGMEENDRG